MVKFCVETFLDLTYFIIKLGFFHFGYILLAEWQGKGYVSIYPWTLDTIKFGHSEGKKVKCIKHSK